MGTGRLSAAVSSDFEAAVASMKNAAVSASVVVVVVGRHAGRHGLARGEGTLGPLQHAGVRRLAGWVEIRAGPALPAAQLGQVALARVRICARYKLPKEFITVAAARPDSTRDPADKGVTNRGSRAAGRSFRGLRAGKTVGLL